MLYNLRVQRAFGQTSRKQVLYTEGKDMIKPDNKCLYRIISLILLVLIFATLPTEAYAKKSVSEVSASEEEDVKTPDDKTDSIPEAEAASEDDTVYETETLRQVNTFDYYADSISTLSDEPMTKDEISVAIKKYGEYLGTPGMSDKLYREAMSQKWEDATDRKHEFKPVSFSLTKSYTYDDLVDVMKKLSRIEGVNLYIIGKSTTGRPMYALEVDIPSKDRKDMILLTGTIHARETAGCTYILKELVDLLQSDTKQTKTVLRHTRFVAVPCVNPDGREGVCFNTKYYTYKKNNELWKATSGGTDLNRNFPGLSWSQLAKGYKKSDYISSSSKSLYYPGPFAGSSPETRAMMKFLYHYVVIEKAALLVDYHQQGRIMYVEKPWTSAAQQEANLKIAKKMLTVLNKNQKKSSKDKYTTTKEDKDYGLNGVGSTMTDYACSIANGSKFSRAYGFNVYCSKTKEYPLIMVPHVDKTDKKLLAAPNDTFMTFTFEIGWGKKYLGYSSQARNLIAAEYSEFNYDKILFELSNYVYKLNR